MLGAMKTIVASYAGDTDDFIKSLIEAPVTIAPIIASRDTNNYLFKSYCSYIFFVILDKHFDLYKNRNAMTLQDVEDLKDGVIDDYKTNVDNMFSNELVFDYDSDHFKRLIFITQTVIDGFEKEIEHEKEKLEHG